MIKIRNLSKNFGTRKIFNNLNLDIKENKLTFIIGESGSGKTTLLKLIKGIEQPSSGEILFENKEKSIDLFKLKNNHLVDYIFQDFNLLNDLNVINNLRFAENVEGKKNNKKLIVETFEKFYLNKNLLKRKITDLSVGEQQRIVIIRSILRNKPIILCDEPTANLDEENAEVVFKLFKEISKFKTVIIVSHNTEAAEKYADNIVVLDSNEVTSLINKNNYHKEENENSGLLVHYRMQSNEKNGNKLLNKSLIGFRLLFGDLKKRWLTAFLVIITFFIVIFSSATALELNYGRPDINLSNAITNADVLSINNKDKTAFSEKDSNKILQIPHVAKITDKYFGSIGTDYEFDGKEINFSHEIEWVDTSDFFQKRFSTDKIEIIGEFLKNNNEIIISEEFEKKLGKNNVIGKTINFIYYEYSSVFGGTNISEIPKITIASAEEFEVFKEQLLKFFTRGSLNSTREKKTIPLKIVGVNKTKNSNEKSFSIFPISVWKQIADSKPSGPQNQIITSQDLIKNKEGVSVPKFEINFIIFRNYPDYYPLKIVAGTDNIGDNEIIVSTNFVEEMSKNNYPDINIQQKYNEVLNSDFYIGTEKTGRIKMKIVGVFESSTLYAYSLKKNIDNFNKTQVSEKWIYVDNIQNAEKVINDIKEAFNNNITIVDNSFYIREKTLGNEKIILIIFGVVAGLLSILTFSFIFTTARIYAYRKIQDAGIMKILGASKLQVLFYQLLYLMAIMFITLFAVIILYYPVYYLLGTIVTQLSILIPSATAVFTWIFIIWLIIFIVSILIYTIMIILTHFRPVSKLLKNS